MFGLLALLALLGGLLVLPVLIVGLVLRLVFRLVLFPFHLLGAVIGLGVAGLVLGVIAFAGALVVGALTLVGALFSLAPILLVALLIWTLVKLLRGRRQSGTAA